MSDDEYGGDMDDGDFGGEDIDAEDIEEGEGEEEAGGENVDILPAAEAGQGGMSGSRINKP